MEKYYDKRTDVYSFLFGYTVSGIIRLGGRKITESRHLPSRANEAKKMLRIVDDHRDLMVTHPPKKGLPPEIWEYLYL